MLSLDLNKVFSDLENNWYKPPGLVLLLGIWFAITLSLAGIFQPSYLVYFLILTIGVFLIVLIWHHFTVRLPKFPKNKLSFVVSIRCENESTKQKVREDFIKTIQGLLINGPSGKLFHYVSVPERISRNLTNIEQVGEFQHKTKANFIIYGRVRERDVGGGKEDYFLDLDGYVSHAPISENVSKIFGEEFGELLPRKVRIGKEKDIYKFQFTSEWTLYVSKYIIAIALALSGMLEKALTLFNELNSELKNLIPPNKQLKNVKERVPRHICQIHLAYCRHFHDLWRESKSDAYIDKLEYHLDAIPNTLRKNVNYYTIKAIFHFIKDRDTKKSEIYLLKIKDRYDVWYFNYAFIKAYDGNLKIAIHNYRKAIQMSLDASKIIEIEEFIYWVVTNEKDKYQLYFCLGFYNWKIKKDLEQALNDFNSFLENIRDGQYKTESKLATNWIKNIKQEIIKKKKSS
ncbi:MAG: hypothetical protein FVQ79_00490 [Planctomycetes bacterium]|nr:hypothetical protein [Planctomycetota bacterium]